MNVYAIVLIVALATPGPEAPVVSPAPDPGAMYSVDTIQPDEIPKPPPGFETRRMNAMIVGYHVSVGTSGKLLVLLDLRQNDGKTLTARLALPLQVDNKLHLCSGAAAVAGVQAGRYKVCAGLPRSVLGRDVLLYYWRATAAESPSNLIVYDIASHVMPHSTATPQP